MQPSRPPHAPRLPARPARSFGASADHWRKNLPVLGQGCRAFAIDLLGYGYSDKVRAAPEAVQPGQGRAGGIVSHRSPTCQRGGQRPVAPRCPCPPALPFPSSSPPGLQPDPRQLPPSSLYNFPTWSRQLRAFIADVVREPAALVCNSVGGLAGLQVTRCCRLLRCSPAPMQPPPPAAITAREVAAASATAARWV